MTAPKNPKSFTHQWTFYLEIMGKKILPQKKDFLVFLITSVNICLIKN